MTGMHEFAEFSAADVGTVESGLNSIVLASNNQMVSVCVYFLLFRGGGGEVGVGFVLFIRLS